MQSLALPGFSQIRLSSFSLQPEDISSRQRSAPAILGTAATPAQSEEAARRLEARGWRAWYSEMFGSGFVKALADHHIQAIEWHWNTAIAKRNGEEIEHDSYIAAWSRGHMKSTIARRVAIADAAI